MADAIAVLAETPDDMPDISSSLQKVAQLAASRIGAVDYAAVSPQPEDGQYTVAVSQDPVATVTGDRFAFHNDLLPPLGRCVAGPTGDNVAATMSWPGFREAASGMGLSIVSMPLFTGSGAVRATLDLCGRDAAATAPLTVGICAAYDPDLPLPSGHDDMAVLDAGGQELVNGFAEALSVRATIQLAVALIARNKNTDERTAYLTLRLDAADKGRTLLAAATAVVMRRLTP
ncbi:ANTAR domain-containing protein [Actinoplanes couchii]|uniref:ANTAR domain-containing protein n=1 Tax=Actinoplanes couchii TaxID=403638 RepID=UPI001943FEBD|nr:ANTAR domain-containing protein [Actinoplanes couchii]MDR6324547.1 hypothetical protein [Actinoplanes couchii]